MEKFSLADIRKKNYADVYHLIYREKRISKQQIADGLQMSLPTVTQHLTALTEDGLVEKNGQLASYIGRKAAAYAVRPTARIAVGVEVLADRVTAVVLNLYGEVIGRKTVALAFRQEDAYFDALAGVVEELAAAYITSPEKILGVGVGIQGLVSSDGREVLYGKILDCTGLTTRRMEEIFPYPCRFFHDAECAAELELWQRPELKNALYLSLGMHLGGAVIVDGTIQAGRTGRTGTFEHMTLVEDGALCYCGKRGCMECYCSCQALLEPGETLPQFFRELRQGSQQHLVRWEAYLRRLAAALNNLHMVVDSEIILGGHIAPYLEESDLRRLFALIQARTAFPEEESFLRQGAPVDDVVAVGAAIRWLRDFLDSV